MDTPPISIYDQYIDTITYGLSIFAGGLLVVELLWLV